MSKTTKLTTGLLGLLVGALASSAGAYVITNTTTGGSVTVSSTDLINNGQYRSAVGYSGGANAGSWDYLTDGVIDQWGGYGYKDIYDVSFMYTLNTASYPLGYTVNTIALTSGWNAESYCSQRYTLEVHKIGVGWIPLVTDGIYEYDNWYLQTITYDTTGAPLATNVDQISLYLRGTDNGGYTSVLYEFDVFGDVPEPASLGLLLLGGLVLLRRRRE